MVYSLVRSKFHMDIMHGTLQKYINYDDIV